MKYKESDYVVKQDFEVSSLDYQKAEAHILGIEHFGHAAKKCFFIFDYYKHNYFHINTYNEYFNNIPKTITEPYLLFNNQIFDQDIDFVYEIHHRAFSYFLG